MIDSFRSRGDAILLVDGGDFFHRDLERGLAQSKAVWHEFARAEYDAITLGKREFMAFDLVEELSAAEPLPIVCTNVEQLIDGQWVPVGAKYIMTTVAGVRVAVLSMISDIQLSPSVIAQLDDEVRLLKPLDEVKRWARYVRAEEGAELVVLLAMVDHKAMEQYATLLDGIDVMVGGYATRQQIAPELVGDVILNRVGSRGQRMASTQVIISPQGEIVDFGGSNVTLGPSFPEHEEVLADVKAAMDEAARLRRERREAIREQATARRERLRQTESSPSETPQPE